MPRVAVDDHKRINLRVRPEQKATLLRAAALRNTDLTDFVLQSALRAAKKVIAEVECLALSERDSLMLLNHLQPCGRTATGPDEIRLSNTNQYAAIMVAWHRTVLSDMR